MVPGQGHIRLVPTDYVRLHQGLNSGELLEAERVRGHVVVEIPYGLTDMDHHLRPRHRHLEPLPELGGHALLEVPLEVLEEPLRNDVPELTQLQHVGRLKHGLLVWGILWERKGTIVEVC